MRVLDVGCGPGIYVRALREAGIAADGVDIDDRCPYDVCDVFSDEFRNKYMNGNYTLCMSLEVAEHLVPSKADEFVARLVAVAPVVLFSAAQPGQGGVGHINCQSKSYWSSKFAEHNYEYNEAATRDIVAYMSSGYHMGWFVNNAQVFTKVVDRQPFDAIIREEMPQAVRLAAYFAGAASTFNN